MNQKITALRKILNVPKDKKIGKYLEEIFPDSTGWMTDEEFVERFLPEPAKTIDKTTAEFEGMMESMGAKFVDVTPLKESPEVGEVPEWEKRFDSEFLISKAGEFRKLLYDWDYDNVDKIKSFISSEIEKAEARAIDEYGFVCGGIEQNIKDGELSLFKGGCGKNVPLLESYRCLDCNASFHKECLRKHFNSHKPNEN